MRRITKATTPECLQTFIDDQLAIRPEPANVTYRDFPHKVALRDVLTREQYGLCGYTGTPVDDRIFQYQRAHNGASFSNHIEHMKCQKVCRAEVEARGQEYGRVLADDLDYHNMIAALEVRGAKVEHFGAVAKATQTLPVLPSDEDCAERFVYLEGDGRVEGIDAAACASIAVLDLNHETLKGWRLSALSIWLDPDIVKTSGDFLRVVQTVATPINEKLPEFAFVIESIAKRYIDENDL